VLSVSILIRGTSHDTMKEACTRLEISRLTLLRSIENGFFTEPPRHRRGIGEEIRYFPEEWYAVNEPKLAARRNRNSGE
jgi:hypothetical protein